MFWFLARGVFSMLYVGVSGALDDEANQQVGGGWWGYWAYESWGVRRDVLRVDAGRMARGESYPRSDSRCSWLM